MALSAGTVLIHNQGDRLEPYTQEDTGGPLGFGFSFKHNGELCRTAVLLPRNPTEHDLMEAWKLLSKAVRNPTPETCVFGEHPLTGHEQRVSSLQTTKPV